MTEQQKTALLKVEMPLESWNIVFQVFEESTAPYKQVVSVKNVFQEQLQKQVNELNEAKKEKKVESTPVEEEDDSTED